MYQLIALANCTFVTYRMIWTTKRLKKPGMSGRLRREIRSRYIEYMVIVAVFSWPICYITKPSYRFYPSLNTFVGGTKYIDGNNWFDYGRALVLWSGLIIAGSRLRDRLLLEKIKNFWQRITCRVTDKEKVSQALKAANINTFLTTSLNTELVVTILKGITILAAASSDNMDNLVESDMLKVKHSSNLVIEQIKIFNPKFWEIGAKGPEAENK